MDSISMVMKLVRSLFDPSFLFILGGGWAFIKLIRSGYVNQLGEWGRWAVCVAGCGLFGCAVGYSDLFPRDVAPWIVCGICLLANLIATPWVEEPARKQAEENRKEAMEKMNALLNTKDENLARERDGIMSRAYTGQYATPEEKQNDILRLGAMLGDKRLGAAWIKEVEKSGAWQQVPKPPNVVLK